MKKYEPIKLYLGAAMLCAACAFASAPVAHAQTAPPATKPTPVPLPIAPSRKGDTTLLTTDTQVPIPASMVLRGSLKADKKTLKAGEPITFTYAVTNTSKTQPQTLQFSTGQRFDVFVQPKIGGASVWQFSKGQMFTMMLGAATFAPGETKTFTATWKPAPTDLKSGAAYTVMAHLTPMAQGKPTGGAAQTAHATLPLTAAK